MTEIHALSGAYAVDALDDIERAQFERHLAGCCECRAEVDSLREAAGLLPATTSTEPPEGLRARVLADIAAVRPLPPLVDDEAEAEPTETTETTERSGGVVVPLRRRHWLPRLVAAAAAVVALGAGATVWHPWEQSSQTQANLSAAEQILQAPDAETYVQRLPNGAEARLVRSRELHKAVVMTRNMPAAPVGKTYELWFQDPRDGMVPAGLMPQDGNTLVLEGDASTAIGAGITVEDATGSHVPTTDPVALFTFRTTK